MKGRATVMGKRADAAFDWFVVVAVLAAVVMLIVNLGRGWLW